MLLFLNERCKCSICVFTLVKLRPPPNFSPAATAASTAPDAFAVPADSQRDHNAPTSDLQSPVNGDSSPIDGFPDDSGLRSRPQARLVRFDSLVDEVVAQAEEAHLARSSGQPGSPVTGFKKLDERIGGGLPPRGTVVVLGNTGSGKTAFALQVAAQCAFPALYVSTEMAPTELFRRQMARLSGQFLGRLKSGELAPSEVRSIAQKTATQLSHLCFVDATCGPASLSFLADCAQIARGDEPKLLVVVDSLHTWVRGLATGVAEYDALNAGLSGLQGLSHRLGAPVMIICEQSRSAMDSGGVNSGAGTRFIEYGAELVLDLQAAKEADALGDVPVTIRLAKNRHGAAGASLKLLFNGALQRFKEA